MSIVTSFKGPEFVKAVVENLKEWSRLGEIKRLAANEFNRHNTKVGSQFAALISAEGLPAKSKVVIDGIEYMWCTTETEVIDPRKWHKMFQDGEITEDQYYGTISVGKTEAKLIIGEDQVATICVARQGTKADIRCNDANAGTEKGIKVVTPEQVKPSKPVKPVQVPAQPPKRQVIVGRR